MVRKKLALYHRVCYSVRTVLALPATFQLFCTVRAFSRAVTGTADRAANDWPTRRPGSRPEPRRRNRLDDASFRSDLDRYLRGLLQMGAAEVVDRYPQCQHRGFVFTPGHGTEPRRRNQLLDPVSTPGVGHPHRMHRNRTPCVVRDTNACMGRGADAYGVRASQSGFAVRNGSYEP